MSKFFLVLLAAFIAMGAAARAQQAAPLRLAQTIALSGVEGRIDHLGVDVKGMRLFVAALGNHTLEVVDLRAGKRVHRIAGFEEPQGVFYVPEVDKIFVADGGDGSCRIYDGNTFGLIATVKFSGDADNVRFDRPAKRLYVGHGDGALGVIEPSSAKRLADVKLEGHPESFQLERAGPRIFLNVPTAGHVAVVDRNALRVIAQWPVEGARANFPMALDEAHGRLFITCRKPPELLVCDIASGKVVTRRPVVGDADDMFYDAARKRIYISGGEGFLSVVEQLDADHYRLAASLPTAAGARTSLFVPDLGRLYLAVPHRGAQGAEVRVYEVQP